MDLTARWRELVQRPERYLPLDEAALLISAHGQPGLDVAAQLRRLDDLAAQLGDRRSGEGRVDDLCALLFGALGLRGDLETYDDPRNSYLDQVLDRGLGIPISLSVLLIEVGRRCGLTLEGVGLPGHFLVRDPTVPHLLIDAFSSGRRLDRAACLRLLRTVAGPGALLTPSMLETTGRRAILGRILANLDRSFARRRDRPSLSWVTGLRATLPDQSARQRSELASRLAELGRFDEAAAMLESLTGEPGLGSETADRLRAQASALRALLN
jgi:regulator of sirC expression with transglutaminase-like and TPR domain